MWKTHGEACSETNLLKWWGFTSTCKRLQETQLWISIHSKPLHWMRIPRTYETPGLPSGNQTWQWIIPELNGFQSETQLSWGIFQDYCSLPIDVTSHNGTLTIAFDDKSSRFYLFLLFTVHSFSDTVGLIYHQDVVAPNAPDAREGN